MPLDAYTALKTVHVLSATVLIGSSFTISVVASSTRRGSAEATGHTMRVLDRYARATLGPIAGLLALSGLMMTVWPLHAWNMLGPSGRWALVGLAGFIALNFILPLGVGGAMRDIIQASDRGETDTPALRRSWKRFRIAITAGEAIYVGVLALMVIKPVF